MTVGIIGTGAWGTALRVVLENAGVPVVSRSGRADNAADVLISDAVLLALPTQVTRPVLQRLAASVPPGLTVVHTAKGLELPAGLTVNVMLAECWPQAVPAVLSGPAFAADLSAGRRAAVTLACADVSAGQAVQQLFASSTLRVYLSTDIIGVAMGGALKNVIATACGMAEGLGAGESAAAGLATRGFAEMRRLAVGAGACESTLTGLSGLGDLMLTCRSGQSRNFRHGLALGQGVTPATATVESIPTAAAALALAAGHNIELPITEFVHAVCSGTLSARDAAEALWRRPPVSE